MVPNESLMAVASSLGSIHWSNISLNFVLMKLVNRCRIILGPKILTLAVYRLVGLVLALNSTR